MVRKRPDGRWEGRIVVGHKKNGNPIFKYVFGKSQKELMEKLHQCIDLYRDVELNENSNMTLGEWLQKWLDEYVVFTVRESTWTGYARNIHNHIVPMLGQKSLQAVTTGDIQKMYNHLKNKGRLRSKNGSHKLSNTTVRGIHMMLHEALDVAVKEHYLVQNPTNGTTVPKVENVPKQILTEEQLQIFMETIRVDAWYDFFYTEMTTGMRRGEICGLKWSDFDAVAGTLQVNRTVLRIDNGMVVSGDTKTVKSRREILLPPSTAELLRKRKKTAISEWIFENPICPEVCVSPQSAYHNLKRILKTAHLPSIRFHDLRHTFATHALTSDVDAKTLAAILGHTNASFTLDTYTHVTGDMQKNASAIVGNFMEEIFGEELKPWQRNEKTEQAQ